MNEIYLHGVRDVVIAHARERDTIASEQAARLTHTKLLYGVGDGTYRGVTVFAAWQNDVGRVGIVEIAATGQESWIQLAGTVIHDPLTAPASGGRCRFRSPGFVVFAGLWPPLEVAAIRPWCCVPGQRTVDAGRARIRTATLGLMRPA